MKQIVKKILVRKLTKKVSTLFANRDLVVIAVTGTVGKTSTKVAIATVLQAAGYKVGFTEDSYNSDVGLPLSVFGLKVPDRLSSIRGWRRVLHRMDEMIDDFPYDVLVQEVAEDDLDLMLPFMELIKPRICVVTGVSLAHTARMQDIGKITQDIIRLVGPAKAIICNNDFAELREAALSPVLTYATHEQADVALLGMKRMSSGTLEAEIKITGRTTKVKTQLVGRHNLAALLAAAAVAHQLEVDDAIIAKALTSVPAVKGRMNLLPAVQGARLIDDSYNAASPIGVFAALETLSEMKGRKIAVLGNMNELGAKSEVAHREVGEAAAKIVDMLIVIGPDAEKYLAPAAIEAGMEKSNVKVFRTPYEAGHFLKKKLSKGDTVLVKGSQNKVFSEEVSRIILDKSLRPQDVLVRQSAFWRRKKKKAFAQ